jgi:hypothetical protein
MAGCSGLDGHRYQAVAESGVEPEQQVVVDEQHQLSRDPAVEPVVILSILGNRSLIALQLDKT